MPAESIGDTVAERAARRRAELAERRVLAVLDNAVSVEQVRPLLPGASGSLILITSRRRLANRLREKRRRLGELSTSERGVVAAFTLSYELLDTNMLLQHQPDRYTCHDLLGELSKAIVLAEEPAEARQEALARELDHYLHTASTAVNILYPDSADLRPHNPAPDTDPVPLAGRAEATAWLEDERRNLLLAAKRSSRFAAILATLET